MASAPYVKASDHDDGITPLKTRAKNLTDLYVFREDNQTGVSTHKSNLVLIMNSNPLSPSGVQRFFSTQATYEFHLSDVSANHKDSAPTGSEDHLIQFKFDAPDKTGHQTFHMTIKNGVKTLDVTPGPGQEFRTTNLSESKQDRLTINTAPAGDSQHVISVFAGLREDPFFFDVDQFFKVRAGAAGLGPKVGFRTPQKAVDFTIGYNVNTIVVKLPLSTLQAGSSTPIFDVWETITSTQGDHQVERLARPAINEGLILTNDFLNAFNMIPPSADLSAAAAPVVAEAAKSIDAFDAVDGHDDTTVAGVAGAFLPDVMRIDTRVAIPVGKTAYNADVSGARGMLTGGRKLEDDVMDITISFLVAADASGNSVKDNVSYAGTPGNPHQGHKFLHGQTKRNGAATFPFLSKPD